MTCVDEEVASQTRAPYHDNEKHRIQQPPMSRCRVQWETRGTKSELCVRVVLARILAGRLVVYTGRIVDSRCQLETPPKVNAGALLLRELASTWELGASKN